MTKQNPWKQCSYFCSVTFIEPYFFSLLFSITSSFSRIFDNLLIPLFHFSPPTPRQKRSPFLGTFFVERGIRSMTMMPKPMCVCSKYIQLFSFFSLFGKEHKQKKRAVIWLKSTHPSHPYSSPQNEVSKSRLATAW